MRLTGTTYYAICMPIGLIWYGWVTDKKSHWYDRQSQQTSCSDLASRILAVVSLLPFGIGMSGLFLTCQTYMVDSFPFQAASAVAAPTCARSLFGAFLPLAGPSLYNALGLGWGNTLLGFVALVMLPIPLGFFRWVFLLHSCWLANVPQGTESSFEKGILCSYDYNCEVFSTSKVHTKA